MASVLAYPHVVKEDGAPAHLASHPRTRVAMIVTDYLAYGWSPDEICRQHTYLKLAEVHAAMAYYYDHQAEIDAEIAAELAQDDALKAQPRPPFWHRLKSQGLIK
jgi:hypothetical protein